MRKQYTRKECVAFSLIATTVGIALVAVLVALCVSCTPAAGWIAVAAVADARDAVDDGITTAYQARVKECRRVHGEQSEAVRDCVEKSNEHKAAYGWRAYGLPAANSAVTSAKMILEIAEKVKASGVSTLIKVLSVLRVAACGIFRAVREWKDLFPERAKTALAYLDLVQGLVCR